MLYASNKCNSIRMKAILKKNTIKNENFLVCKKNEKNKEDVFVKKLLRREKLTIHLLELILTDQYH